MNNTEKAENVALKLLRRRYSKRKLCQKLREKGFSAEIIQETADKMENLGYINDSDYARAFVHDCILLNKYGPRKIKQALFNRGIPGTLTDEALSEYDDEVHIENIKTLLLRFSGGEKLSPEDAAKFYRRMESRGFLRHHIEEVLSTQIEDNYLEV